MTTPSLAIAIASVSPADPMVPAFGTVILPLKAITPLVLLVIVSSFSRIIPADPVTSMLTGKVTAPPSAMVMASSPSV